MTTSIVSWRGGRILAIAALIALADLALARDAAADILVFEHAQFRGRSVTVGGVVPDLSSYGMNDAISSVRVLSGAWELCEHANFQGRCIVVDRDVFNMEQLGFNDRISSIRPVRGGNWSGNPRRK